MLMRPALVPTAEAVGPTVAGKAAGLVAEEDREDTKSPGRHLAPGSANKLSYILYPLFFHKLLYSLQDIKWGTGGGEASCAYLNSTGSSHDELHSIAGGSDAAAADNRQVYCTSYLIYHI